MKYITRYALLGVYDFSPERQIKDRESHLTNLPRPFIATYQTNALTSLPFSIVCLGYVLKASVLFLMVKLLRERNPCQ